MGFFRFNRIRILKILIIFVDFYILYFFCKSNFSLLSLIFETKLNLFFSLLCMVSINYLIGKYDIIDIQNVRKMIIYFFKKNIINLSYILIVLIILKTQFITLSLLFLIFNYFLSSLSSQIILILISYRLRFGELRLNIYGTDMEINLIKNKILSFNYTLGNKKLIFKRIYEDSKINFIDHLLVNDQYFNSDNKFLSLCKSKGVRLYSCEDWVLKNFKVMHYIKSDEIDFIKNSSMSKKEFFNSSIKRFGDILLSSVLIITTTPILFITFIFIWVDDGLPIFYCQERSGLKGKKIRIFKLRSMVKDAEKTGAKWAISNDERVTKVGSFLRKFRIDELPQLISVFKGDMSLIGPRPERPLFDKKIINHIPNYKLRLLCKPGLSGWAQVNYPYGASIEDAKNKFSYDAFYIFNSSLKLDFYILLKTIKLILSGNGSDPADILN